MNVTIANNVTFKTKSAILTDMTMIIKVLHITSNNYLYNKYHFFLITFKPKIAIILYIPTSISILSNVTKEGNCYIALFYHFIIALLH